MFFVARAKRVRTKAPKFQPDQNSIIDCVTRNESTEQIKASKTLPSFTTKLLHENEYIKWFPINDHGKH